MLIPCDKTHVNTDPKEVPSHKWTCLLKLVTSGFSPLKLVQVFVNCLIPIKTMGKPALGSCQNSMSWEVVPLGIFLTKVACCLPFCGSWSSVVLVPVSFTSLSGTIWFLGEKLFRFSLTTTHPCWNYNIPATIYTHVATKMSINISIYCHFINYMYMNVCVNKHKYMQINIHYYINIGIYY